jgi:hypothetical protein
VGVGVTVGEAVGVALAFRTFGAFSRGSDATSALSGRVGSMLCSTQYVAPPPMARQLASAAAAAPGRTRPHARERRRVHDAVVHRRCLLLRVSRAVGDLIACGRCAVARSLLDVCQRLRGAVDDLLDRTRMCLLGNRHRQECRNLLAPEVKALVHRAARRAACEVKLRLPPLARTRQTEREARHQRFTRLTAAAGEPDAASCAPGYSPCLPPYPPDIDCADTPGEVTSAAQTRTGSMPTRRRGLRRRLAEGGLTMKKKIAGTALLFHLASASDRPRSYGISIIFTPQSAPATSIATKPSPMGAAPLGATAVAGNPML